MTADFNRRTIDTLRERARTAEREAVRLRLALARLRATLDDARLAADRALDGPGR